MEIIKFGEASLRIEESIKRSLESTGASSFVFFEYNESKYSVSTYVVDFVDRNSYIENSCIAS